ncbi:hypothetical protein KS4_29630 [Poriferisphaera corsica]|uniref:Uncharacterized protein n=1 Tax=Poriferisphaera corsica TaxID=2528020 RepID=A0A517YXD8_9BACT|nr:hypothetical protein [Poriferisphaera corsica]QDU34887.1 hypothetical protein KS4_29630 [Poriferisphaera corsica]
MTDSSTENCENCDYELLGLPAQGSCPECGHFYNKLTGKGIANSKRNSVQKFDRLMLRARTIALASIAVIIMLIGVILSFNSPTPGIPLFVSGIIAFVFLLATVLSFLSEKTAK